MSPIRAGKGRASSCTELARRADTSALTVRRRLEAPAHGMVVRLATEVDLDALYVFLSETVGALEQVTTTEVTRILTGVERTGLVRPGSL